MSDQIILSALRIRLLKDVEDGKPIEWIEKLISLNPKVLQIVDKNGETPLQYILRLTPLPSFQLIQLFVTLGPDAVKTGKFALKDNERLCETPLHTACNLRYSKDVLELLATIYPDAAGMKDLHDETPIQIACKWKLPMDVVQMLVEKCPRSVQVVNKSGRTALHSSCEFNAPFNLIQYLANQWPMACLFTCANDFDVSLPLAIVERENRSKDVLSFLFETTVDASCAFIDAVLFLPNESQSSLSTTIYWNKIDKHVKKSLGPDILEVVTSRGFAQSTLARSKLNSTIIEKLLNKKECQDLLKNTEFIKVLETFFEIMKAARNFEDNNQPTTTTTTTTTKHDDTYVTNQETSIFLSSS